MPPSFPTARLRQAGISDTRITQLQATYNGMDTWRQQRFRAIVASAPDEVLRRTYDPTGVPAAAVTATQLAGDPALLTSVQTAILAAHDTDAERETFTPARLADAALRTAFGSSPGQLVGVLRRAQADAVWLNLGDSMGNETTEWVYLTAQWLGSQFPAYTVSYRLWNDTNQTYDPAVTIQTGTGSHTLTIYNCSVPGAGYNYPFTSLTRFTAVIPAQPTLTTVAYVANSTQSAYRASMLELSRWVLNNWPGTEYAVVTEPPKAATDPDFANDLARSADVRTTALSEGWGLIDVTQPFLDDPNYATNLLKPGDIHPNDAGTAVWVAQVKRYLGTSPAPSPPRTPPVRVDRVLMDPTQFILGSGTPAIGIAVAGIAIATWALDPAADEYVVGTVDVPSTWRSANVYLLWATAATTGSVVWQVDWQPLTDSMNANQSGKVWGSYTAGTPQTVTADTTAYQARNTAVYTAQRFAGGRPLSFRVRRLATNAADTCPVDALFAGLLIERAE